jgi:hypothetical protein
VCYVFVVHDPPHSEAPAAGVSDFEDMFKNGSAVFLNPKTNGIGMWKCANIFKLYETLLVVYNI